MRKNKSKYFFIETLIACFFLALSISVCFSLLNNGYSIAKDNEIRSIAAIKSQNIAEIVKSVETDTQKIVELTGGSVTDDGVMICYDDEWNEVSEDKSTYVIRVEISVDEGMLLANINVYESELLYSLEVVKYLGSDVLNYG